jgi:hypothetical protein
VEDGDLITVDEVDKEEVIDKYDLRMTWIKKWMLIWEHL